MYKYHIIYHNQFHFSLACGIDLGDSYVVTGGLDGSTRQRVAQYSVAGDVTYLANLNTGRYAHACSQYVDDNGDTVSLTLNITKFLTIVMQTLLVTAGRDTSFNYISSTEIHVQSTWSYVSSLPSGRGYLPAATVDNVVYIFGNLF